MDWTLEGGGHEDRSLSLHLRNEGDTHDRASFTLDRLNQEATLVTPAGERRVRSIEELDRALEDEELAPIAQAARIRVEGILIGFGCPREEA